MYVVDDHAIGMHSGSFGAEEFYVGDDLLLEVKLVLEEGMELVADVGGIGSFGALDCGSDNIRQFIVVNALVVGTINGAEDGVSYVSSNLEGNGLGVSFFGTDYRLVDLIDAVSLVLNIHS